MNDNELRRRADRARVTIWRLNAVRAREPAIYKVPIVSGQCHGLILSHLVTAVPRLCAARLTRHHSSNDTL